MTRNKSGLTDHEVGVKMVSVLAKYPGEVKGSKQVLRGVNDGSVDGPVKMAQLYRASDDARKIAREQGLAVQIDRIRGTYVYTGRDTIQGEKEAVTRIKKAHTALGTVGLELIGTTATARVLIEIAATAQKILSLTDDVADIVKENATQDAKRYHTTPKEDVA